MSALRGTRSFASIGLQSIRLCRTQQQRKIASVVFPALSQKIIRASYQDAILVPVNKFDLSGSCGVLSSSCSVMFSTVTDALSDETSSSIEESDPEAGKEHRWPSPVHQQSIRKSRTLTKNNSIFIGGYNFDHTRDVLEGIFSRFGEVVDVLVPRLNIYNQHPSTPESYRFAFINFKDSESVAKALEVKSLMTPQGNEIEIKQRSDLSKGEVEKKRTIVLKNLPNNFTVQKCVESFGSNLDLVNIVFDTMVKEHEKSFAFLVFKNVPNLSDVESATKAMADDVLIEPFRVSGKPQPRRRNRKVYVEKIPLDLSVEQLEEYFTKFGEVTYSKLFDLKEGALERTAVFEFASANHAIETANDTMHDLNGSNLIVRSLGWVSGRY